MDDSTIPVRLCPRRPAYGLLFRRDSSIGGGVGISSTQATAIRAGRPVGEVTGLPSAGERLHARSLLLAVAESPPSTGTPRGLIPRGPALPMAAFTVVERGEMTFRFSSVRSALVWARVRAAGGLEETILLFPLFPNDTLTGSSISRRHVEREDSEQA